MSEPLVLDSLVERLDLLPSHFVSAILRADALEIDGLIEHVLQQTGEALVTDHVSSECGGDGTRVIRAWNRTRSAAPALALTIPVVVGGSRLGALSVALGAGGTSWPPAVESRLRTIADLLMLTVLQGG